MLVEDYSENYITGWVKLYRSFVKWEWFEVPNMVTIFIYCLLKANHKDKNWRGIEIKKGSFVTSLETISKETKVSIQSVRTCLKRLENTGEINKQSNKQNTIITICKYDTYQENEKISTYELTNNQQTTNKQLTTTNNDNNIENTTTLTEEDFKRYDDYIQKLSIQKQALESIYETYKLKKGSLSELTRLFIAHLKIYPKRHITQQAFKQHFFQWLSSQEKLNKLNNFKQSVKGQL